MLKFLQKKSYKFLPIRAENLSIGDVFVYYHLLYETLEIKDLGPDDVYVLLVSKANGVPLSGPRLAAIPRKTRLTVLRNSLES
jgi:hypothetical protein